MQNQLPVLTLHHQNKRLVSEECFTKLGTLDLAPLPPAQTLLAQSTRLPAPLTREETSSFYHLSSH